MEQNTNIKPSESPSDIEDIFWANISTSNSNTEAPSQLEKCSDNKQNIESIQ